jgi:hypothetical protein
MGLFEAEHGHTEDGGASPGMFSFRGSAGFARAFHHPFQVNLLGKDGAPGKNVVVRRVDAQGFVLMAENGKEVAVSAQELATDWGGFLVWLFPQDRFPPRIGPDSSGPAMEWLQKSLGGLGYTIEKDGRYGPRTREAVAAFQERHGLAPDGAAGFQTLGLLYQLSPEPLP